MNRAIGLLPCAGAQFISVIFLDSLRFKFTGHPTPQHVFEMLRDWSGVGLCYPAGPWIISAAGLGASILLVAAPLVLLASKRRPLAHMSQFAGALIAIAIMSGAIVFHFFTPLGIATPTEWAKGDPTAFSSALFYSACASWVLAATIALIRRGSIKGWRRGLAAA